MNINKNKKDAHKESNIFWGDVGVQLSLCRGGGQGAYGSALPPVSDKPDL